MDIVSWIDSLKVSLEEGLPGEDAQMQMSPLGRQKHSEAMRLFPDPTPSAVLILLYPQEKTIGTLFMVRNSYDGHHSGQVSYPGGKVEDQDLNLADTAIREFEEEIGINLDELKMLGKLSPLLVPPSGFIIHPYVGFLNRNFVAKPDPSEVAQIFETTLQNLFDEKNKEVKLVTSPSQGFKLKAPSYVIQGHTIWGATAMITSELEYLCKSKNLL